MRGKLSQAIKTPFASAPGIVLFALVVSLAGLTVGCEEKIDPNDFGRKGDDSGSGWSMPWKSSRGKNAPFEWPAKTENPQVEIKISSDGDAVTGRITIELMPDLAPKTVEQFLAWVDSDFYMGTTFHRVVDGFMIQGGDPNSRDRLPRNDGKGGPGFLLEDEFSRAPFERGVVGMGNKGRPDSAGSQFFIMLADQPSLNGRYTVIGRVAAGMETVDAIARVETDKFGRWGPKDRPKRNVVMTKLTKKAKATGPDEAMAGAGASSEGASSDASGAAATRQDAEFAQSPRE
jgi:peptidyl-prolyl cis-trans isomerase B (cyclophilin B)